MTADMRIKILVAAGVLVMSMLTAFAGSDAQPDKLAAPEEFAAIADPAARSAALFTELCTQVKDPERNGGKSFADLAHHIGDDTLVGWAWNPGYGRTPAPGTQKEAKALFQAWVDTGAGCPN